MNETQQCNCLFKVTFCVKEEMNYLLFTVYTVTVTSCNTEGICLLSDGLHATEDCWADGSPCDRDHTSLVLLQRKLGVYWRLGPDLSIIPPPNIITDQFWIMTSVSNGRENIEQFLNKYPYAEITESDSIVC